MIGRTRKICPISILLTAWLCAAAAMVRAQSLESELQRMDVSDLIDSVRQLGDAARGAIVFHQPGLACAKCHRVSNAEQNSLGPDLTTLTPDVTDESLIESLLFPSKVIRQGFESVLVLTVDGRVVSGILVEQTADKIVLRDAGRDGEWVTFEIAEVEDVKRNELSLMPAGQMNQLASRQQFFDLMRYLFEILDHAGFIRAWNDDTFRRGEMLYQRVCASCHGTHEQLGSLPTSLRFAEDKFKNGSDPLSMYRTLTHGYGQMAPQTWMVPSQKYDVIHYIREAYLRSHRSEPLTTVDEAYLASLPTGYTFGPESNAVEAWSAMDYGPSLIHTYEIPGPDHNFAYKGIAVRLDPGAGGVSRGSHWMIFDTDTLRMAAGWSAGNQVGNNFIDWRAIQFNGEHGIHPTIVGQVAFANATGPGWADPRNGQFTDDQRVLGRDGKPYGPLPRPWGRFHGMYLYEQQVILAYNIGDTEILEMPRIQQRDGRPPLFLRTLNIGPRASDLTLRVAQYSSENPHVTYGVVPHNRSTHWLFQDGQLRLRIPAGDSRLQLTVWVTSDLEVETEPRVEIADLDLATLTHGGPPRWPQVLTTRAVLGASDEPLAVDILTAPESNPWLAQTRFTGLDFFSDGRLAVCTWDGDVWVVTPRTVGDELLLDWQRIASGLFQPLGLKILRDKIHLTCRDLLAVLHDLNGDGEIDFYENLNNDHQVTEHFHEFAMGLQTDAEGNFYYAKSGCHGKPAIVPHHGTLLKVTPDGSRTEILANGFRAANGVCLNPDGSFLVTDQEGFWNPKNRINWVTRSASGQPKFYGNMLGYHHVTDSSDSAMEPPLCWITNDFDRSPAELLWVTSAQWGPLNGSLLNLSYGYGKVFLVLHEEVAGIRQGGMIELPLPNFPTGVMRGRFHPDDGQLYLCGMFAWAGSATHPGGLFRVRYNRTPDALPLQLHAHTWGLELVFSSHVDPEAVQDANNYSITAWDLERTARYGSEHFNQRTWEVNAARLLPDGKTVRLEIPEIAATAGMEIVYRLRTTEGQPLRGRIHNTIHRLHGANQ